MSNFDLGVVIGLLVICATIWMQFRETRDNAYHRGWKEHTGYIVKSSLKTPHVIKYRRGWETYYVKVEKISEDDIRLVQGPGGSRYFLKNKDD